MIKNTEIFIPVENANDETVTLIAINYEQGTWVKKGDIIFEIETSKSIMEVESPSEGYFFSHHSVNDIVIPGKVCGYIGPEKNYIPLITDTNISLKDSKKFSAKAIKLINENNLDPAIFSSYLRVRESDVVNYIDSNSKLDVGSLYQFQTDSFKSEHLVLWGAGLQAIVVLDLLASMGKLGIVKCIIDKSPKAAEIQGIPIISSSRLDELITLGASNFHICIGNAFAKSSIGDLLKSKSINIISLIHPTAHVSSSATIADGVYIGPFVYIGPEVTVGKFSQINNCSSIAHHSELGHCVMISDGCHIGGTVKIGDNSLLGIGVIVNRDIIIGDNVNIPSGEKIYINVSSGTNVKSVKRFK